MALSGLELDLDLLRQTKVTVSVPKGMHIPMCFCGDSCKLVQCRVLGYRYDMRFFMCDNYEYDPIRPYGNVRPNVCETYKPCLLITFIKFVKLTLIFSLCKDSSCSL